MMDPNKGSDLVTGGKGGNEDERPLRGNGCTAGRACAFWISEHAEWKGLKH